MGKELAGIITDEETDAFLYPARIVEYSSYIGNIYSTGGVGSFFFIPKPIRMGGFTDFDFDKFYEERYSLFGDISLLFALPIGKSFSLGICPKIWKKDSKNEDYLNSYNESQEKGFGVLSSLFFAVKKIEVDGAIMATLSDKWDTLWMEKSSYYSGNDTTRSFYHHKEVSNTFDFFYLIPSLRITFKSRNIAVRFSATFMYRFSDIDTDSLEEREEHHTYPDSTYDYEEKVDTSYTSRYSGFLFYLPKLGFEWSKEEVTIGAAITGYYENSSRFSVSFPFGIEYSLKPLILRLGLKVEYRHFPTSDYLHKSYTFGMGFTPTEWLSIDFLMPYGICYFPDLKTGIKIRI